MTLNISVKMTSVVFFLSIVLLFQTVTFSPIALAEGSNEDITIPSWFKNNAKWWANGQLNDEEIINAIKNLLDQKIIKLDSSKVKIIDLESSLPLEPNKIPDYVKDVFMFWEQGFIDDDGVGNAIKFLIESNIIVTSTSSQDKQQRPLAAIIDQLDQSIPNKRFQDKILEYFENAGYDVDIYTTEEVTLDFFKKLPSMNYKFIIFRTHSFEIGEDLSDTFLFTGEKYDVNKYIQEQLFGQVQKGVPIDDRALDKLLENDEPLPKEEYFVVGSKMIDELMVGSFPQSVIIIGGCESVRNPDLAQSFINRGASAVVGWDRSINSLENDRVILALMEEILINNTSIHDSIVSVMDEFGSNLQYSSELIYFHT